MTVRALSRTIALVTLALALAASGTGCKKKTASDEGPTPVVRESSEGLLFTYIDEKGGFQVVDKRSLVPEDARALVRVVDTAHEGGDSDMVFVVDLRQAGADGLFAVSRMKRTELEARALARRSGKGSDPTTKGDPDVIIYGAEWCGPCHQAAAFLTQRGVPFVEKDIEKDASAAREMQAKLAKSGQRGGSIPVLDVRGTIIVGFSAQAVSGALH